MMNDQVTEDDLFENPSTRVPVVLCLDTSDSMKEDGQGGVPIDMLNRGIDRFCEAIKNDEAAKYSLDFAVITFGGAGAVPVLGFGSIDGADRDVPTLTANGRTPLGAAVKMSLQALDMRKEDFKQSGVDYYQPWLILMSDGHPTDSGVWEEAARDASARVRGGKLSVYAFAIGSRASIKHLEMFSPKGGVQRLEACDFIKLFEWLSQSVSTSAAGANLADHTPEPFRITGPSN